MASVLIAFVALIVVVEPLGVIPFFLSATRARPSEDVRRIARRSSIVGALVLLGFAVFGRIVLTTLGIPLDAFRVAGGIVLLLAALDMIRQKSSARCFAVLAAKWCLTRNAATVRVHRARQALTTVLSSSAACRSSAARTHTRRNRPDGRAHS